MIYGISAALFALITVILVFFSMIYPAWFQQRYKGGGADAFQGFGMWAFYSSSSLSSPFLAAPTTLHYNTFCGTNVDNAPNWMYGAGDQYQNTLCGGSIRAVQVLTGFTAAFALIILLAAIAALYRHEAGLPERIVSGLTLIGALLFSICLIVWGWLIQQNLYQIDAINQQYQACKASSESWSCWFYGYAFWVALAGVISMSITGYLSSAARGEKVRKFRLRYENDITMAVQASLQDANQRQNMAPAGNGYVSHETPSSLSQSRNGPATQDKSNMPGVV